jgi:hypothetical protein
VWLSVSCASREAVPSAGEDSTIVFPSTKPGGVEARITLYEKTSKKTGKLIGEGRTFQMGEDEKVRALVEIENPKALGERPLLFHLVWLDPEGSSVFTKRLDVAAGDSPDTLESAISIPPDKREPGLYTLRVYLFRELIAEKTFTVRS